MIVVPLSGYLKEFLSVHLNRCTSVEMHRMVVDFVASRDGPRHQLNVTEISGDSGVIPRTSQAST